MSDLLNRLHGAADADAWSAYRVVVAMGHCGPRIHLQGALVAQRLGLLHSAHYAILEAIAGKPEGEVLGRVRFVYGTVLRELGRPEATIDQFDAWLRDLADYPTLTSSHLGAARYNRGLALRQVGRYSDSVTDYTHAAAEFRRWDKPTWLVMCLHNMAWVACLAGQPQVAADALAEAEPLSDSPTFQSHQRLGEAFVAAITLPVSARERVISLCRRIIDNPDAAIPASVRSHANWLAGRVALDMGLLDDAHALAEAALLLGAAARDEDRCLTDAIALWEQIRDRKGGEQLKCDEPY